MANLIQIKRSTTTAAASGLANGEMAYTANGDVLFIGSNGSTVAIAGARTPGTLTANQALVANATGYMDVIKTANLYIGTSTVNQINAIGNSTFLGAGSNNELATSYAIKTYIDLRTGANAYPQGSNGAFQYNNSGALYGTNNFFYDNSTGSITVGNTSINVQLGYISSLNDQMAHFHGNANSYVQTIFSNANTGNNASVDLVLNPDNANDTNFFIDLGINGSNYNQAFWTINGADDGYLYVANGGLAVGTSSAKPLQFFTGGTLATNEAMRITAGSNVGIGNTAPNAKLAVTGAANISGAVAIGGVTTHSGNVVFNSAAGIVANGSIGTAGQTLLSNGTSVYWGTGTSGSNTQVQFNDSGVANASAGFTFNKTSNTLSIGNTINTGYIFASKDISISRPDGRIVWTDAGGSNANDMYIDRGTAFGENVIQFSSAASITNYLRYADTGLTLFSTVGNTFVSVGNTSVNTRINSSSFSVGSFLSANSSNFTFNSANFANTNGFYTTGTVNGAVISVGSYFQANSTSVNAVAYTTSGNNFVANSTGVFANVVSANAIQVNGQVGANSSGVYTAGVVNGASIQVGTAFIANSTKVTFTGANIDATSAVLSARDVNVSGNLTVSGTLTAINSNTLEVKDNMIKLADNQANSGTYTDTVSAGWYMTYGNTANVNFAGMFRDQATSSANFSIFKLFHTHTEPTTTVDTTDPTYVPGLLVSWLSTPTSTLIANTTVLTIQPNTGINVTISANTLTLTQALAATSGGTGQNTYSSGDILVANTGNTLSKLSLGTSGKVLQSNGTALVYDVLDGGTF